MAETINSAPEQDPTNPDAQRNKGLGRIIIAVYGIFALAAFARALFQILTKFDVAPVPFLLSGFAAVVYIIATVSLAKPGATAWKIAFVSVLVELVGVVGIGIWSFISPEQFPEPTVWSHFGEGYGYVPLVLPIIGLIWLLTHKPLPKEQP